MQTSVPPGPSRSATSRAWPPPPNVQSTAVSPGSGSRSVDQLGGQDWDVLGGHVGQCGHLRTGARDSACRARRAVGQLLGDLGGGRVDLGVVRRPSAPCSRSRGGRRRRSPRTGPRRAPACSIRWLGIRTRPAESRVSSCERPWKRRLIIRPLRLSGLSSASTCCSKRAYSAGRIDLDAGVEAGGENHPIGQRRPEAGRDREPVLGVEAVLVLTAKRQPWGPLLRGSLNPCGRAARVFGPEWRGGRSLTTPVLGSDRIATLSH